MRAYQIYTEGNYLEQNPSWHIEDSPWKAEKIAQMINKNNLFPKTVCEVGCGAGGVLQHLQENIDLETEFWGYDISPQAIGLCVSKTNAKLHFKCANIKDDDVFFDVVMVIDVIEHLEDYFGFLRAIKSKGKYKIFHIPLDLSVQAVMRASPIQRLREHVGHIHSFTKESALATLMDAGYDLVDYFYTAAYVEAPAKSVRNYITKIPRKLLFSMHQDLAVRILGGYSLMVLAK